MPGIASFPVSTPQLCAKKKSWRVETGNEASQEHIKPSLGSVYMAVVECGYNYGSTGVGRRQWTVLRLPTAEQ